MNEANIAEVGADTHELLHDLFGWIDPGAVVLILLLIFVALAFRSAIKSKRPDGTENPIEFWHFYSSRSPDGRQFGDPDKLGVMVLIVTSSFYVGYMFWEGKIDNWHKVIVFAIWMLFMSAAGSFAKWARTFVSRRYGKEAADGMAPPKAQEIKP